MGHCRLALVIGSQRPSTHSPKNASSGVVAKCLADLVSTLSVPLHAAACDMQTETLEDCSRHAARYNASRRGVNGHQPEQRHAQHQNKAVLNVPHSQLVPSAEHINSKRRICLQASSLFDPCLGSSCHLRCSHATQSTSWPIRSNGNVSCNRQPGETDSPHVRQKLISAHHIQLEFTPTLPRHGGPGQLTWPALRQSRRANMKRPL